MRKRYYPSAEVLLEGSGEKRVLLHVQRSFRSILSDGLKFLFFLSLVVLFNVFFPNARIPDQVPFLSALSPRWLAIFPAYFLIEMLRKYHDDLYIFGVHRITHLNGRLSLNYSVPSVKYGDIRAISVRQDIAGRMFDFGNVEIGTAAQENNELEITGVRAPRDLANLLDSLRLNSKALQLKQLAYEEAGLSIDIRDNEKEFLEEAKQFEDSVAREAM